MSSRLRRLARPLRSNFIALLRALAFPIATSLVALVVSCGGGTTDGPPPPKPLTSITIDGAPPAIERGSDSTLTATAHDAAGVVPNIPFVWRSSADSILTFGLNGHFTTNDTGVAVITASALNVTSGSFAVHVVWASAAAIAVSRFSPPTAVDPGTPPVDSIRVLVTNILGGPAIGARVVFAVTAGGGTVSPSSGNVTSQTGIVAAQWTLGPLPGKNSVTATVVGLKDSLPVKWVKDNPATFTLTSYVALSAVAGDNQTAGILSSLAVAPSVKLVDSAGKPRAGIPITFTPTNNGRVAKTIVSTGVDGVASPGVWTLGDAAGDQQLIASVEGAKLTMHATATGTTVTFAASALASAQAATCALTSDQFVSCFGQSPQNGTGDTASVSSPTLTKGGIHFSNIVGGGSHFCGISTPDLGIYCWGVQALPDTLGIILTTNFPVRVQGTTAWIQVSPGSAHNCALANDKTAWCWGADASGQLGDNGSTNRFAPRQVLGGFRFNALAAGGSHECGLTADASAFCWGLNSNGQLGDGTTVNRGAPTAVSGALKYQTIGAGNAWTCALGTGATLGKTYCWGATTGHVVPIEYFGAPVFTSLSVGAAHACALTSDGTAYCWGDNTFGQLGDSTTTGRVNPTAVAGGLKFTSISAGVDQTCGITSDGVVACWGRNQAGEIGVSVAVPQQLTPRLIILGVKP